MTLTVGQEAPPRTFAPFTRTDFVKYQGASGDFHPLHHDETYAHSVGFPSVFSVGMLQAGLLATYVTDWLGVEGIRRFKVRFVEQMWPGDELTCTAKIVEVDETATAADPARAPRRPPDRQPGPGRRGRVHHGGGAMSIKRTVYNADHEAFRLTFREFLAKEVTPHFADWEADGRVPRELFHKLGALGVMGFGIPEEYGGPGDPGYAYQAIISEETARATVAIGHYGVTTTIVLPYLLRLANDEQRRRWLPGIATGDIVLCIAMTEPGTGSDLAGIRTTATLSADGTHYVLNGAKTFITGARNSELCVVAARTSPPIDGNRRPDSACSSCPPIVRDSSSAASWTRSACAPATPTSCPSPTCAFR
jgi:acyl dehydratase